MNWEHVTDTTDVVPDTGRARWALRMAMIILILLLIWASLAKVDQVTRAQAQIIASAKTQVVQAPDTGVLTALNVREGDSVEAGQVLMTLERDRAQAAVNDSRAKVAALRITLERLKAEVYGESLRFSPELQAYGDYVRNQTQLYNRRKSAIQDELASLESILKLAEQELAMNQALVRQGDVSRADIIRLERNVADIRSQMTNKRNKYFQDAQAEMTKAQEDLNTQTEQLRDRSQVLEHTELTAPLDGIVKNIRTNTVGGVVRAGDVAIEILPLGGDLIAEAKVSPADIGFIEVGQKASVKLDAYDFSIYGAMQGEVSYISADTLTEETRMGPQSYYRVHITIRESEFKSNRVHNKILVRPGMTATVDIKAMERTVLNYLTKPITKTLSQSMGER